MLHKPSFILVLCSVMSMGLFAETAATTKSSAGASEERALDQQASNPKKDKYTFSDFFDALDLPTVLGVGVTPNGIEGATFNSAMRLGWRQHKNYGAFVYITYDTHSQTYDSLQIDNCNIYNGEVWYNEVGMSVGYRFPLVKDIKAFYANPYFHPWDLYISVQPGVSIATVKNVTPLDNTDPSQDKDQKYYTMSNYDHVVPTLRFSAGVEWFIVHNFSVFAEAAYTQHLLPTLIEQAAQKKGEIQHPSGPLTFSIGLSLFFK